jgi:hypothetical protein
MTKIIPLKMYKLITRDVVYTAAEEGLPPPDSLTTFYNKFTDEYRTCTLDQLEQNFRYVRSEFGDLIDESTGDDWVDFQLTQAFLFTHWTPAVPYFEEE